jgi:hypothetical protein
MRDKLISSEIIGRLLVLEEIPGEEIGLEFSDDHTTKISPVVFNTNIVTEAMTDGA